MTVTTALRAVTIDNFEQKLDPPLVSAGEQLYATQDLKIVSENEPGLYNILNSQNTDPIHTEIWLNKKKIKSVSCECRDFKQQHKLCVHIPAALYALKEYLTALKIPVSPVEKQPELPSLSLNNLLEVMTYDDLVNFIKHSIRENKDLGATLKLKYAHLLLTDHNELKYETILQSIFRPFVSGAIGVSNFKKLIGWLEEGVAIGADLIVLGHWKDAVLLLTAISRKIHYLAYRKPELKIQLLKANHLWFISLRKLVSLNLPPEIKLFIQEKLYPLATSPHYKMVHFEENVHTLLWIYFWNSKEKTDHLNFLEHRKNLHADFRIQHFMCSWLVNSEKAITLLDPKVWTGAELETLTEYFLSHKKSEEVDLLVNTLLQPGYSPWLQEKMIDHLIPAQRPFSKSLTDSLWKHLQNKPKPDVAIMLWDSGDYGRGLLQDHLDQSSPDGHQRLPGMIAILAKNLDWLYQAWECNFSPLLLKPWLPLLLNRWEADMIIELVTRLLKAYFQVHLGEQPLQLTKDLLDNFYQREAGPIAKELKDILKRTYPERYGLYQL